MNISVSTAQTPVQTGLCTGSLGDPIVKIDFGSGTGRGPALGTGITSYTYSSSGFPMDGFYTVANTTAGMLGEWWSTTDHTGNPNGYMMVVNSSISLTDYFYKKTVTGLCPGTTYEFAAWVMNIFNVATHPNPNLTFNISTTSGTVLGTYTTGAITPNTSKIEWKQFGFFFTTSNSSDVVITIVNNSPGAAPGNDLVLDDITFRACGPTVDISFNGGGNNSKDLCEGQVNSFLMNSLLSNGYSSPAYQWQWSTDTGKSWQDINGAIAGTYQNPSSSLTGKQLYRLNVAEAGNIGNVNCRISSSSLTINVMPNPAAQASSNNPACFGDSLVLNAASGATTYSWTGPNGFSSNLQSPKILNLGVSAKGKYYVKITNSFGCSNTDSVLVDVNGSASSNAGPDMNICEGQSIQLEGNGTGSSYVWSPAKGLSTTTVATPIASPTDTTDYTLSVSNGKCTSRDTMRVVVWKKPIANAGPDQKIYEGNSVQLHGNMSGSKVIPTWSPNYNLSGSPGLNPIVWPQKDTTYYLTVNSTLGCGSAVDPVFIRVYKKIQIPNVFSPNGDGIHDHWHIVNLETYPEADITVFNRYGTPVYTSKGYTKEWDGNSKNGPLPVGTYYYVIQLHTEIEGRFAGWVVITR